MTLPGWRDWAFALKTFGAAILALYLAMWLDLPRPYWAVGTVYITSQVLAGATRSKAVFRVAGTLLGAVVTVVLVPNLVNAPPLLCLAIALWVSGCLYLSLLDRTPGSYLPMLAGYTAALIGFPAVGAPEAIFDTAVARAEEIILGILCASLVSSLVLPQSVAPVVAGRLDQWIAEARTWVGAVLARRPDGDSRALRLRLAASAVSFDALAIPLRYDRTGAERSVDLMATLRQHMLMFLPIAAAVADRIGALERTGALTPRLSELLDGMAAWLAAGRSDPAEAERLREAVRACEPALGPGATWDDLVRASLMARLSDFIDLRQDTRLLQRHIAEDGPLREPLAFRYTAAAREIRHRDHGLALLSAFGVFLAILLSCAIWIATGWPDGAGAPMMAAVACCFFAAQDDPVPAIVNFANSAVIGAVGAGLYLFAVLPLATSFEMLALALAPGLILAGVLMTQPRTQGLAMGAAVNGFTMIALQNGYTGDFAPFVNSAVAVIAGMWIAAVVIRLVRSVGAAWSARRLRAVNRRALVRAASWQGGQSGLELAALMLDRVGLIAPRLAALPQEDAERTADLVTEVRIGINLVELRRIRRRLPPAARLAIERLQAGLARHFRSAGPTPDGRVLADLDAALAAALAAEGPAARAAVLGLVGLRRALFPEASPPTYARTPSDPEAAAMRAAA